MNAFTIIKISAIILSVGVIIYFLLNQSTEELSFKDKIKVSIIGLVSNFFDTIGIGSFATIVAMRRMLHVMPDDVRLIGTMNLQAMVTALVQALIFLQFIPVDLKTLLIAVAMITLGGFLSSLITVNVKTATVHRVMLSAFIVTGVLLLLSQLNILEIADTSRAITGTRLVIFSIFMLIAGALPAFGVGYYSLVKASIFLFGVNPIIAFPIMASASAFQMPITSVAFIAKKKIYFKSAILLAAFGTLGVFLAAPIISMVNIYTLKWILLAVVVYNVITLAKSTVKNTKAKHHTNQAG